MINNPFHSLEKLLQPAQLNSTNQRQNMKFGLIAVFFVAIQLLGSIGAFSVAKFSSLTMTKRRGYHLTKTPIANKGASFTAKERSSLGLRGLFPAGEIGRAHV